MSIAQPLLKVEDLTVKFSNDDEIVTALDQVSFEIPSGKTICLVGESGCGKSVTAKAILRILDKNSSIEQGQINYERGNSEIVDLASLAQQDPMLKAVRGNEISMIYQEPMSSLSPLYTIGSQIVEVLHWHQQISKQDARDLAIAALEKVALPNPNKCFEAYSFELSGGMRQRAMIAMALVSNPRLLIADEPTTALDVTTQANILDLLHSLQRERNMSMLFITHDFGVVAEIATEVVVMYLGNVVEQGSVEKILTAPRHPYTKGLLASLPSRNKGRLYSIPGVVPNLRDRPAGCPFQERCVHIAQLCKDELPDLIALGNEQFARCHGLGKSAAKVPLHDIEYETTSSDARQIDRTGRAIIRIQEVSKHFPIRGGFFSGLKGTIKAVNNVSLDIWEGETLGLVGESGCGKTTLGQTIIGLQSATAGNIEFSPDDTVIDLASCTMKEMRNHWQNLRMVFQDPNASLNPRMTVFDIIAEVLRVINVRKNEKAVRERVMEVIEKIGLDPECLRRYPHAFSGGQRQRIGIARALATYPKVIIADEAVSALDVSVQSQILNLLKDLQRDLNLTYIFISHDLGVVSHISDRVAVMYAGSIVEQGDTKLVFGNPRHPYTKALISAIPEPRPRHGTAGRMLIEGSVPDPSNLPSGCSFASRCPRVQDICRYERPVLDQVDDGREVSCHFA